MLTKISYNGKTNNGFQHIIYIQCTYTYIYKEQMRQKTAIISLYIHLYNECSALSIFYQVANVSAIKPISW